MHLHATPNHAPPALAPARGLAALAEVKLRGCFEQQLDRARATAGGPASWRSRKVIELRDLLALEQISGRMHVECFDVSTDLRAVVDLLAPVPLRGHQPDAPLEIGPFARLGLMYREEVLVTPQPGFSFVQILLPRGVWHPNVSRDNHQVVCLGSVQLAVPLREIVLMTYGALTMQSVQFSAFDSVGVMNQAAAEWWQGNAQRIPLSREPFILNPAPKS